MDEIDKPDKYQKLPEERKQFLLNWIKNNLKPIQRINLKHTSYEIKHWIEDEYPKEYFTNGEFKGAMLEAGYLVNDTNAENWQFNISEQSPYLEKKKAQFK